MGHIKNTVLIHFSKMHGLGNDFVVIDRITQSFKLRASEIQALCQRRTGIGCDQLLLIEPPIRPEADFFYRIFNPDGTEVEQCGNGLRCAAQFFYDRGLGKQRQLEVDCLAGTQYCQIEAYHQVRVQMPEPCFEPADIPIIAERKQDDYDVQIEGGAHYKAQILSLGNPHAIIRVAELDTLDLSRIGPALSTHALFPKQANIGFMQIIDRKTIRLRVYERGAGETLACGSNACAAVVSGIRAGDLDAEVRVLFPQGALEVQWTGIGHPIFMRGPVQTTFAGQFAV